MKKPEVRSRLFRFLGSELFFRLVVGLLILQSLWIALSARYPMAFDEDFHLGIIRLYAHHMLPFWNGSPNDGDSFGAVARDPSYLYHFLFGFIYRFISLFTHNQTVIVIILRFINIGLFATTLPIFRRLLHKAGASKAIVHASLLAFVLVPIVPFLAGQINYDNLFIPLTGIILLLAFNLMVGFQKGRVEAKTLVFLLSGCLLTCLVKYAFLPIFLAIGLFVTVRLLRTVGFGKNFWRLLLTDFKKLGHKARWLLVILLVCSFGLFAERYAVNAVRYHNPIPECDQVLTIKRCHAYGPWIRDYDFATHKTSVNHSPVAYSKQWVYGMWLRLFFAVEGPTSQYQTRGPFEIPAQGSIVLALIGLVSALVSYRKLMKRYNRLALAMFAIVPILYLGFLWATEYKLYIRTGQPVAINGRYLLPVLLPLLVIFVSAYAETFRRWRLFMSLGLLAALLTLAWGGGALTYILRSNDAWYWPAPAVKTANHAVQRAVGPIIPGNYNPIQFLR